MDWNSIVIALVASGLVGSAVAAIANRRNNDADTYQKLVSIVNGMADELAEEKKTRRQDVDYLNQQLDSMRSQFQEWANDIFEGSLLNIQYMQANGMKPPYTPKPMPVFRGGGPNPLPGRE